MVSCATFTRQWLSSIVDCKVWWMAACKSQRLTFTRRHLSLICQLPEKWISCKSSCIFGFKLILLATKQQRLWQFDERSMSVNIDKVTRRMQITCFPNSLSNYDLDCVEDEVMVMHRIKIWIFHKTVVLLLLWLSVTEERCPSKSLSASAVNANRWWNSWRLFLIKNYNISPRYIMVTGKHRTTFIRERNVFPERRGQWCGTANVRKLI